MRVKRSPLPVLKKGGASNPLRAARSLRDVCTDLPARQVILPAAYYEKLRQDLARFFRRLGKPYHPAG